MTKFSRIWPYAKHILGAGTATANTAPLKFTTGTNLTTAEAGAVEYDGKILYFTPVTARKRVMLGDDAIVANTTVANTTTETTIFTATYGANTISVGDVKRVNLVGFYSTLNASDLFTIRFKIGGTTILTGTSIGANVTDSTWHAEFFSTFRTIGVSGTVVSHVTIEAANKPNDSTSITATTVDTTASNNITVTVQWSAASVSNTLTINQGFTERI